MVIALLIATPLLAGDSAPIRFGKVITERGAELAVEIAATPEQRERGYMFRERMGPEDGMLFLFEEEGIYPFWMKNTKIPLDIIWIGGDGVVVFVAARVPPCTADPCPDVRPLGRARSVLELAAGRASDLGLRPGAALQLLVPPSPD
jgi:uncharacterized membrane protein (UPF0127 family)